MSHPLLNYSKSSSRPTRVREPSVVRGVMRSVFWTISAAFILCLLGGALYFTIPLALVIAPLLGVLLVLSASEAARVVRRQRGMVIIGYLHQAVSLNLPLPTMLASAEQSEPRVTRRRLHDLCEIMQLGLPLHDGLRLAVPEMSDRAVELIRAAESNGSLARTLQRLLDENHRAGVPDPMSVAFYRAYPLVVSLTIVLVLSIFTIFVMPRYQQIFRDFGVPLPAVTVFVLACGRTLALPLTVVLVLAVALLAGRAVDRFFVARPSDQGVFRGLTDRLIWLTPLARQAARDAGLADVFQTLGDSTHNGQTFVRAVEDASRLYINVVLARRVARWLGVLEAGSTPAEGARLARLPPLVAGLLSTARTGDDTSAVLEFLARYYRSRFSRTRAILNGAFVPAVALALGMCVCVIALAMFMPLLRLIDVLSHFPNG